MAAAPLSFQKLTEFAQHSLCWELLYQAVNAYQDPMLDEILSVV